MRLEDSLPVVTHFAFRIQDQYNSLVQAEEDDQPEKTFIVGELVKLAVNLDYADENGRRQMFSLTRKCSLPALLAGRETCADSQVTCSRNPICPNR